MNKLTARERRTLARSGCTVVIESQGIATCRLSDGRRVEYAIETLKEIAQPTLCERVRDWISGVVA